MVESELTQSAPILTTLLVLIVVFAVDSVNKGDSLGYRLFIGTVGLGAIGPIGVVLLRSVNPMSNLASITETDWYIIISLTLVIILVIRVVSVEVLRDIEKDRMPVEVLRNMEKELLQAWLRLSMFVIVFIWYLVLFRMF